MSDRDQELRRRIVSDPRIMVGQPCIRDSRLTVRLILNLLAHDASFDEILAEYPGLTPDDIFACLLHAADLYAHAPRSLLAESRSPSVATTG